MRIAYTHTEHPTGRTDVRGPPVRGVTSTRVPQEHTAWQANDTIRDTWAEAQGLRSSLAAAAGGTLHAPGVAETPGAARHQRLRKARRRPGGGGTIRAITQRASPSLLRRGLLGLWPGERTRCTAALRAAFQPRGETVLSNRARTTALALSTMALRTNSIASSRGAAGRKIYR